MRQYNMAWWSKAAHLMAMMKKKKKIGTRVSHYPLPGRIPNDLKTFH
jgi:hypothetical protein